MKATCTPMAKTVPGMRKGSIVANSKSRRPLHVCRQMARAPRVATQVVKAAHAIAMPMESHRLPRPVEESASTVSKPRVVRLAGARLGQGQEAETDQVATMAMGMSTSTR